MRATIVELMLLVAGSAGGGEACWPDAQAFDDMDDGNLHYNVQAA